MTIGFDARLMSVPGGIPRYCRELLLELSRQNPQTKYVVLVKFVPTDFPERTNIEWLPTPIQWYGWAEQIKLGFLMNRRTDVDLWHIPHWNVPLTLRRPFIMTIHDFILEEFPTHSNKPVGQIIFRIRRQVWRWLLNRNVARAQKIITISDFIKNKICERWPIVVKKVFVTSLGVTPAAKLTATSPIIQPPYFLVVGNSYPHKNLHLILETYAQHPEITAPTIIATHRDRFSQALADESQARELSNRIKFLFDVDDQTLNNLYQNAAALVFPSLAEGFGLPPLEAFAYGLPVIALPLPPLQETLGNLAIWTKNEPTGLANSLKNIINRSEPETETTKNTRRDCAAQFTWLKTALSTQKIYEIVL